MSKSKRVRASALLAVTMSLTVAACGSSDNGSDAVSDTSPWEDVVAAAEDEGAVTLYSSQVTNQLEALKESFESAYPEIELTFVRGGSDSGITRAEAEAQTGNGVADLLVTASAGWVEGNPDLFVSPRGPDFDEPAYDRETNAPDDTYFITSAFVTAFGWDTDKHPDPIQDLPDFLDPELSNGKLGVATPDTPSRVDFYRFLEAQYGDDVLERLAAQEPRIYPNATAQSGALLSGEIVAATWIPPLVDEKDSGAAVDWVLPKPAWGTAFHAVILESSPNPNAAQVLANFMVTPEGQEAMALQGASVLPDIPTAVVDISDVEFADTASITTEDVQEFQTRWEELFLS